ncbi:DUF6471 domain-containing protein [Sphingomonas kyeonggiensis]|uniref:DUF6471 domain-containing protein n=1 Tax=Sphingomonas kyeonggiensis TaxID=1268553 RepID=UPI00358F24B1
MRRSRQRHRRSRPPSRRALTSRSIEDLGRGSSGLASTPVDSEPNIRNKISRSKFTAVFLIQCLEAIGAQSLRLSDG